MWKILHRAIVPFLLLIAGVSSLLHGARGHSAHVWEEQEIEIALTPPPPQFSPESLGPSGWGGAPGLSEPPGFGGPSGMEGMFDPLQPFGAPAPQLPPIKQVVLVGKDEPETVLVREVTIGGLMLLNNGQLQRTYSGTPPSLCPT